MVDFNNSYCFVGNNAQLKNKVMGNLSKKLNIPVIDIEKFLWLPKLDDPKITPEEKALREKYPDVPNLYELGLKKDDFDKIKEKYGTLGVEVYQRQFEIKLVKALTEKINGKVILGVPARLSDLTASQKGLIDQIKADSSMQGAIISESIAVKNATKEVTQKFKNVLCTNNPANNAKFDEKNKGDAESKYDGAAIAEGVTHNLDSSKYFDKEGDLIQSEVTEPVIDELVAAAKQNATTQTKEEPEKTETPTYSTYSTYDEPERQPSKFGRFLGKVFGVVANVATLGIYGAIKKKILANQIRQSLKMNEGKLLLHKHKPAYEGGQSESEDQEKSVKTVPKKDVEHEREIMDDGGPESADEYMTEGNDRRNGKKKTGMESTQGREM